MAMLVSALMVLRKKQVSLLVLFMRTWGQKMENIVGKRSLAKLFHDLAA